MEVRRQLVVAPAHQHIADITGDHLARLNAGPLLAFTVFTGTNLQAAPAGALEQQRQTVKIGVRAGPPHPLLRLLSCIVMQHTQGALVGVSLRIVRGGENDSGKPSFKAKQERIFIPSCQHCDSNPSIVCRKPGSSRSLVPAPGHQRPGYLIRLF